MNLPRASLLPPALLASFTCAFALGCINITTSADPGEAPDATASLGLVSIDYAAVSDGDVVVQASVGTRSAGIPATSLNIARGSTFLLSPVDRRPSPPAPRSDLWLTPADDATLTISSDGHAQALSAGLAGIVIRTPEGATLDFLNLQVAEVSAVAIERNDLAAGGALVLAHVGESVVLGARALSASRDTLAGTLPWVWTSSDPNVIELTPTSQTPGSRIRATVKAAGNARITVSGASVTTSVDVEVNQ